MFWKAKTRTVNWLLLVPLYLIVSVLLLRSDRKVEIMPITEKQTVTPKEVVEKEVVVASIDDLDIKIVRIEDEVILILNLKSINYLPEPYHDYVSISTDGGEVILEGPRETDRRVIHVAKGKLRIYNKQLHLYQGDNLLVVYMMIDL